MRRYLTVAVTSFSIALFGAVLVGQVRQQNTAGSGSGTVTDVSVVTANGFSGSVANSTTTPAITLTLGAGAVALSQMADLAQDQFIGRTTASTGVPQTATITAAARTVLDDTTVGGMVDTLFGAAASGTGGACRVTSCTMVTPILGTPTSGTLTNATGLPISTGVSGLGTGVATFLGTPSSANLAAALTDETGTGLAVFGTAPTFASTMTIGTAGGTTGAINLKGTTSGTVTVTTAAAAGTWTMTLPTSAGSNTQVLQTDGAGVTSWVAAGSGANTALSNLASVAIATALIPSAAAGSDFGSATLPWKDLYLAGASGTPGTNNFKITGTSTSGTRTLTLADGATTLSTGTMAILGANTFTALQTITQASTNAGVLASTGYSLTGTNATSLGSFAGTLNTTGNPKVWDLAITETASGSTTRYLSIEGGAAGTTDEFYVQKGGVVVANGAITAGGTISAGSGTGFSAVNGNALATVGAGLRMSNNATVAFARNQADSANLGLVYLDTSNVWQFTDGAANGAVFDTRLTTLGEDDAITLKVTGGSITGSGTTVTNSITGTWNTTGVVPGAVQLNITNTASGAGSRLLELQRGGTLQFGVTSGAASTGTQIRTAQATVPTVSAGGGTSPSIAGSDSHMTVTLGTSVPVQSTFTVTFNGTWATAPACAATRDTTGTAPYVTAVVTTTTTAVVNLSGNLVDSEKFHLVCGGIS